MISFRDGRLSKDTQVQEWMDRQNFKLKTNDVNSKNLDVGWFDELYEKAKKLTRSDEIIPLLDLYYQDAKGKDTPKEKNLVNALAALLLFRKLRKNFLHFQCLRKDDEQQIVNFIAGIEPILGDYLYLDKQNYPVNREAPERTVKFSFQRVVGPKKKNVTQLVIFNLMLKIMQEDELWIK